MSPPSPRRRLGTEGEPCHHAAALHEAAAKATDSAAVAARRLADALKHLQAATPPCVPRHRRRWSTRSGSCSIGHATLLQAAPVTLKGLPADLVADWMAEDGRARIQVLPRGSLQDNASIRHFAKVVQDVVRMRPGSRSPSALRAPLSSRLFFRRVCTPLCHHLAAGAGPATRS